MRKWATLAMTAWFFVVFDPNGKVVSKVEFKELATCDYFKVYAQIKANETCEFTGGTCPTIIPNVVGCYWEQEGPATPPQGPSAQ